VAFLNIAKKVVKFQRKGSLTTKIRISFIPTVELKVLQKNLNEYQTRQNAARQGFASPQA